jgi:dUTP pyrophosphatase
MSTQLDTESKTFTKFPSPTVIKFSNMSSEDNTISIMLEDDNSKMPEYANVGDAAMDLFASKEDIVSAEALNRKLISTGIHIAIPFGYYGRIAPRSGLSVKGIDIGAGVIDSGYRGELKILIINNSNSDFIVTKHLKIAQLIITKILENPKLEQVASLEDSERGSNGFGSSGN